MFIICVFTAGLLSRLKSLRPDLVPQSVPHQSSAVSFPKAPASMRNSLYELSEQIKEQQELPSNRQPLEKEISNRVNMQDPQKASLNQL